MDENVGRPAGERSSNNGEQGSPGAADGRQKGMTHASYATMLELGLAALEREDDLDPCLLERLRQRYEALAAVEPAERPSLSIVRHEQRGA